ncbi:MAG: S8 family peptidase [Janthinobacterium lividum]
MPGELPHLLLLNSHERANTIKKRTRGKKRDESSLTEGVNEAQLQEQAVVFRTSLASFSRELGRREEERSPELEIPATLTSIEIEFLDWFDSFKYESIYYGTFGLRLNKYTAFNTRGLFTVEDDVKFNTFLQQFRLFVECSNHADPSYNKLVRYVKSFEFHSAERINAGFRPDELDAVYLSLVSISDELSGDAKSKFDAINSRLLRFLEENGVLATFNPFTNAYELKGASHELVSTIARNFDVVHTINSSSYGVIRESAFGLPTRGYPFSVATPAPDLPIIGIIDTGVSRQSPLAPLIVADDYSVAGTDAALDANGHGTSVAAFAALGHRLAGTVNGILEADARILPIKVLSGNQGYITHQDVGNLIIRAHESLGVRIFVLAVGYASYMRTDEAHSDYAYYLDQLAQQLDVLIVIATGNYKEFALDTSTYPHHYLGEETNLCSPAESMNNLTVGSIGSNLEDDAPITPSSFPFTDSTLPTAYTRKFHLDSTKWKMPNKRFFKPDVVYAGGNYSRIQHQFLGEALDDAAATGLQCLSIEPGKFFDRAIGTSFSAPLVANLAARLSRKYPSLRLQTIKALIVNGAEEVKLDSYGQILTPHQQRGIAGNGVPSPETCLSSDDAEVTVVIQRTISVGTMEAIQVAVPAYLTQAHKNVALLEVTATLCFAIRPVSNSPVAYCPVHMAFGVFRAIVLEDEEIAAQDDGSSRVQRVGINGGETESYVFKDGWSQDAYYKPKPLTNTQKTSFYISREHLREENGQFKVAVECHFHKLLPRAVTESLPTEYEYSLVLRFKENVPVAKQTQSLYDELQLCNDLEVLGTLDLDAEGNLELIIEN